jgi:putative membrane protein
MGGLIVRVVISALALWVAQLGVNLVIPGGMRLTTELPDVVLVAVIFGVVNALIKPIADALACLPNVLTLGLFTLVVNALMLLLTSYLAGVVGDREWLMFSSFWAALLAGLVVSIVSTVLSMVLGDGD